MAESKYKRLISNTAIVGIGTLGSKVLMYFLVRFYTEILSSGEYSVASNITETASLLIPIISFGIGEAIFRFGMDDNFSKNEVFSTGIAIAGTGFVFLAFISPLIGLLDYFSSYEWLIAVYVTSSIIHTIFSQFIRSQNKFALFAFQGILNTLFTVGFNILFLIPLKMGIVGYVLSVACADISSSVFMLIAAKLWRYVDYRTVSKKAAKSMLVFSLPLIPTTISWWVTNVSDRYMVTYFKGDDANGIYAVAYKIPTLLTVLVGIFNNAWKYSAVEQKDSDGEEKFVSNVSEAFMSLIFTASAFIVLFSKPIAKIMFASDYYSAWIYIPTLSAAMLFSSLSSFFGTIFISRKKSVYSLVTTLIPALANIALNFALIPLFSGKSPAMGAALATLISYFIMFVLKGAASRKLLEFSINFKKLIANSLLMTIMIVLISFEVRYSFLISLGVFVTIVLLNIRFLLKCLKSFLKK